MNRSAALLFFVATAPAIADDALPVQGGATFAGGRGHISFEAGWVDLGVGAINPDGTILIDDVALDLGDGDNRIQASALAGSLTFDLPGEDTRSWLGRKLRLKASFERQRATDETAETGVAPTLTSSIEVRSVSSDGTAFAYSNSNTGGASASAFVFSPDTSFTDTCSDASGNFQADAFYAASTGLIICGVNATNAAAVVEINSAGYGANVRANGEILSGAPISLLYSVLRERRIETRRGSLALEGDYSIGPALTLSPSLGLAVGETKSSFENVQTIFDNDVLEASRSLRGRTVSHDAGIELGARLTHDAGHGFDLFVSGAGTLLRRKVDLTSQSFTGSNLYGLVTAAFSTMGSPYFIRTDTIAAFQGQIEGGAGYTFDPDAGLGPLRIALTGGVSYDSDVATYGNVAVPDAIPAGPVAPAHIAYEGETTLFLKGEITVEFP